MIVAGGDWQPFLVIVVATAALGQGALQSLWGSLVGAANSGGSDPGSHEPDCGKAWEAVAELRFEAKWWKWAAQTLLAVWVCSLVLISFSFCAWSFCSGLCGSYVARGAASRRREAQEEVTSRRRAPDRAVRALAINDGD